MVIPFGLTTWIYHRIPSLLLFSPLNIFSYLEVFGFIFYLKSFLQRKPQILFKSALIILFTLLYGCWPLRCSVIFLCPWRYFSTKTWRGVEAQQTLTVWPITLMKRFSIPCWEIERMPLFFSVGEDLTFFFGFLGNKKTVTLMLANVSLLPECLGMSACQALSRNCSFQTFPRLYLGFIWL